MLKLGRLDEAAERATSVLAIEPHDRDLLGFAAQVAMLRGDGGGGLASITCGIARAPDYPGMRARLVELQARMADL